MSKIRSFLEAEDTTLQRYRTQIDTTRKSAKRKIETSDDPLDKAEIKADADTNIAKTEKKINTLKRSKKPPRKTPGSEITKMGESVMVDEKEIRAALDAFENDDFITSKEKLKGQIVQAKNDYLKNKLGLEKNIDGIMEEYMGEDGKPGKKPTPSEYKGGEKRLEQLLDMMARARKHDPVDNEKIAEWKKEYNVLHRKTYQTEPAKRDKK